MKFYEYDLAYITKFIEITIKYFWFRFIFVYLKSLTQTFLWTKSPFEFLQMLFCSQKDGVKCSN